MTTPVSAGPPARPGPSLLAALHTAWAEYRAAEAAETEAWELPETQAAYEGPPGPLVLPAAYVAAQAQTEQAWRHYLELATAFIRED